MSRKGISIHSLIFSVKGDWLESASRTVGIYYPPSFLFLIGIFFVLLILIHFSVTVSKLHQMDKKMAQELALLKNQAESIGTPAEKT